MEDIKDIIVALRPLKTKMWWDSITCHIICDSIDIKRYPKGFGKADLFFHSKNDHTFDVYFILYPYLKFVKNREELIPKNDVAVLSGKNVFQMIGIEYSHNPNGLLDDLYDLSVTLKANWKKICKAFSDENIMKTYNVLVSLEGNNQEEINRVLKTVHNLVD